MPSLRNIWTFSLFAWNLLMVIFKKTVSLYTDQLYLLPLKRDEMLFFMSSKAVSSHWPDASAEYFQKTRVSVENFFLLRLQLVALPLRSATSYNTMPKLGLNVNILSLLADIRGRRNIRSETKQTESSALPTYFSFKATATYKQDL